LLGVEGGGYEIGQKIGIFDTSGDLNGSLPIVIIGTLTESHFDDFRFSQFGGIIEDSILGRSTRSLGYFLGHQVKVPIFFRDSILANDGTSIRIEKSFLVLGEESFTNSLLNNHFHEFGIVFKVSLGNVLEAIEDLFNFIF